MSKTKVKPFNDLPFEERNRIAYYNYDANVLLFKQIIATYSNDISPRLKKELSEWKGNIERVIEKEYDVDGDKKSQAL